MIWTIERSRALKEMLASGLPADEIAARLGCSIKSIRIKAIILKKYNEKNAEEILNLWKSGLSFARIGQQLGISKSAVRSALQRIGALDDPAYAHLRKSPSSFWTNERDQKLCELIDQGLCATHIAREFGVWPDTIQKRAKKLGLIIKRFKRGDKWPKEDDAVLKEKLEAGLSYSEIANILGVTRGAVAGRVYRLGLKSKNSRPVGGRMTPRGQKRQAQKWSQYAIRLPAREPAPILAFDEEDLAGAVIFSELTSSKQCRWPIKGTGMGMLCCARQVQGHPSYCPKHHLMSVNRKHRPKKGAKSVVKQVIGGAWA